MTSQAYAADTVTPEQSPANIPADPSQPVTFDGSPVKIAVETDGSTKTTSAGGAIVANPDGSVAVLGDAGEGVASIAAPWAKDANGVALPTKYPVEGSTLTQEIDMTGAAFPVVADPVIVPVIAAVVWVLIRACLRYKTCTAMVFGGLGRLTAATVASVAVTMGANIRCVTSRTGWRERVDCSVPRFWQ